MDIVSALIYIVVVSREKYEGRRGTGIMIRLKRKNIVIIYMFYSGDMVSLSPFLEAHCPHREGDEGEGVGRGGVMVCNRFYE